MAGLALSSGVYDISERERAYVFHWGKSAHLQIATHKSEALAIEGNHTETRPLVNNSKRVRGWYLRRFWQQDWETNWRFYKHGWNGESWLVQVFKTLSLMLRQAIAIFLLHKGPDKRRLILTLAYFTLINLKFINGWTLTKNIKNNIKRI